jgi:host factor-I protein
MPAKKKLTEVVDVANTETLATATKTTTKRKYTKKTTSTEALSITAIKVDEAETIAPRNEVEELATSETKKALEPSTIDKERIINILPDSDSEDKNKKNKKDGGNAQGKEQKEKINVQDAFYEKVMQDKVQVTIHLNKIKFTGVITRHDRFSLMLESNGQEQFIYKQTIFFISAPMRFRKPFVRRDRPFYNTNENITNQTTDQATAIASQSTSTHSEINARENTSSQIQTPTDKTENRPAKTYSSSSSSTFQTIKSATDKSNLSSNKPIDGKSQVQVQ